MASAQPRPQREVDYIFVLQVSRVSADEGVIFTNKDNTQKLKAEILEGSPKKAEGVFKDVSKDDEVVWNNFIITAICDHLVLLKPGKESHTGNAKSSVDESTWIAGIAEAARSRKLFTPYTEVCTAQARATVDPGQWKDLIKRAVEAGDLDDGKNNIRCAMKSIEYGDWEEMIWEIKGTVRPPPLPKNFIDSTQIMTAMGTVSNYILRDYLEFVVGNIDLTNRRSMIKARKRLVVEYPDGDTAKRLWDAYIVAEEMNEDNNSTEIFIHYNKLIEDNHRNCLCVVEIISGAACRLPENWFVGVRVRRGQPTQSWNAWEEIKLRDNLSDPDHVVAMLLPTSKHRGTEKNPSNSLTCPDAWRRRIKTGILEPCEVLRKEPPKDWIMLDLNYFGGTEITCPRVTYWRHQGERKCVRCHAEHKNWEFKKDTLYVTPPNLLNNLEHLTEKKSTHPLYHEDGPLKGIVEEIRALDPMLDTIMGTYLSLDDDEKVLLVAAATKGEDIIIGAADGKKVDDETWKTVSEKLRSDKSKQSMPGGRPGGN
ncbi:hypothetical protein BDV95DRAFT_601760 [Massariosphaeria phaeospora]|uniref:Uncharacterized protein n=1 Tax=Massariosphaeria phaeospora TaxID=100035 RepID=A0A7C8IIN1_9PLEO|nr:hypothetical protein BDV95DRAFT_601760 [Massariosphaeria phaeospora]